MSNKTYFDMGRGQVKKSLLSQVKVTAKKPEDSTFASLSSEYLNHLITKDFYKDGLFNWPKLKTAIQDCNCDSKRLSPDECPDCDGNQIYPIPYCELFGRHHDSPF